MYAERVEVWYAQKRVEQLPRLRGRGKHRIDYRHVIDWLVRKPGAFADYRYRADLFPSSRFRMAYDLLRGAAAGAGGQGVPAASCTWRPARARAGVEAVLAAACSTQGGRWTPAAVAEQTASAMTNCVRRPK